MEMLLVYCLVPLLVTGRSENVMPTVTVPVGQDVNLTCSHASSTVMKGNLFWIRISAVNTPQVLASANRYGEVQVAGPSRVTAHQDDVENFHLQLREVQLDDAGFYFCIEVWLLDIHFLSKAALQVKGAEPDVLAVEQNFSIKNNTVELQCSVLSQYGKDVCAGEETIHWFKFGTPGSANVLVTHERRGDECEQDSTTRLQRCRYRISRNISSYDETLYCAVASCGHILFGNGTNITSKVSGHWQQALQFVNGAAVAFSLGVIFLLIYMMMKKENSFEFEESSFQAATGKSQYKLLELEDLSLCSVVRYTQKKADKGGPLRQSALTRRDGAL
ncbi:uncharacterized protein ACB058_012044 [Synchiropus picturatus]